MIGYRVHKFSRNVGATKIIGTRRATRRSFFIRRHYTEFIRRGNPVSRICAHLTIVKINC